jgi:hypothetical protein
MNSAFPTAMEDQITELERRVQVEELWGRRRVMAAVMNAERFMLYRARRDLACPGEPVPEWKDSNRELKLEFDFAGPRY